MQVHFGLIYIHRALPVGGQESYEYWQYLRCSKTMMAMLTKSLGRVSLCRCGSLQTLISIFESEIFLASTFHVKPSRSSHLPNTPSGSVLLFSCQLNTTLAK